MKESVYQRFLEEVEDHIVPGYPKEIMHTDEHLNDEIAAVVERFQEAHGYSERTYEEMVDNILIRDAIIVELKKCGYEFENDLRSEEK